MASPARSEGSKDVIACRPLVEDGRRAELEPAWTYDALGSLTSAATEYDGDELASFAYELDELGRIVTVTETVDGDTRVIEYAYDEAGRLAAVDIDAANVAEYAYDGNGNRIEVTTPVGGSESATIDAQDRLVAQGDVEFAYAVTGELLSRSEAVLGVVAVTQYEHDAFGQLVAVELPDATLVEYERDARGRRVSRAIDGVVQQRWLYRSQLQVVAELDAAGDVVSRFVYGSNGHVPDLMVQGGSTYRLVVDHVGSVRLVVDVATGAIAQRLDYGPWGEVLVDTNPGFQPFGFAGGLYDAATGLVHFGARDYDARIGRWISKDPVGFDGGTNHFAYCEGDPVNLIDPDGENPAPAAPPAGPAVEPGPSNGGSYPPPYSGPAANSGPSRFPVVGALVGLGFGLGVLCGSCPECCFLDQLFPDWFGPDEPEICRWPEDQPLPGQDGPMSPFRPIPDDRPKQKPCAVTIRLLPGMRVECSYHCESGRMPPSRIVRLLERCPEELE